ncbi:MAG: hypothetical protein JMDDDDMK_05025 [Acidobacteria bacterium]|nr:hypothetical protein [Acidobacteriota bacterium]
MKSVLVGIKNVLLWSYARGTWQYDALCLGIVLAVFLVPSKYFGDRDRTRQANEAELHASKAVETYIEADALNAFLKERNKAGLSGNPKEAARLFLKDRLEKNVAIINIEPFTTPDGKVIYKIWFK